MQAHIRTLSTPVNMNMIYKLDELDEHAHTYINLNTYRVTRIHLQDVHIHSYVNAGSTTKHYHLD